MTTKKKPTRSSITLTMKDGLPPADAETIQVVRYAGRAVELAREISGADPEPEFLERLETARSNRDDAGSGRDLYERHVTRRERVD